MFVVFVSWGGEDWVCGWDGVEGAISSEGNDPGISGIGCWGEGAPKGDGVRILLMAEIWLGNRRNETQLFRLSQISP